MARASTKDTAEPTAVARRRPIDDVAVELINTNTFDPDALREATTLDDFAALTVAEHGDILAAEDVMGDGFQILTRDEKSLLIDKEMLIMDWAFRDGDFASAYVSMRVVAKMPGGGLLKAIVNDGGAGIPNQLASYQTRTGRTGGLKVKKGLRVSEYDTGEDGRPVSDPALKTGTGSTYYLAV